MMKLVLAILVLVFAVGHGHIRIGREHHERQSPYQLQDQIEELINKLSPRAAETLRLILVPLQKMAGWFEILTLQCLIGCSSLIKGPEGVEWDWLKGDWDLDSWEWGIEHRVGMGLTFYHFQIA